MGTEANRLVQQIYALVDFLVRRFGECWDEQQPNFNIADASQHSTRNDDGDGNEGANDTGDKANGTGGNRDATEVAKAAAEEVRKHSRAKCLVEDAIYLATTDAAAAAENGLSGRLGGKLTM